MFAIASMTKRSKKSRRTWPTSKSAGFPSSIATSASLASSPSGTSRLPMIHAKPHRRRCAACRNQAASIRRQTARAREEKHDDRYDDQESQRSRIPQRRHEPDLPGFWEESLAAALAEREAAVEI